MIWVKLACRSKAVLDDIESKLECIPSAFSLDCYRRQEQDSTELHYVPALSGQIVQPLMEKNSVVRTVDSIMRFGGQRTVYS